MATKRKQGHAHNSTMSAQTKKFLQKICYKETASVDMTKHGFANDNHPIRVFIQPLRSQLEKLHDQDYKKSDDKPSDKPSKKLTWSEKGYQLLYFPKI
ncbi:unnamed protein product [Colias eurytheme]|nr:unnamed protein product [Colias eurytheme]